MPVPLLDSLTPATPPAARLGDPSLAGAPRHWDLHCRVVDNWGDAGIAWRLAADLAHRGALVRLFIDDPAPLSFMAPHGAEGVSVHPWGDAAAAQPGEAVVETFGCALPEAVEQALGEAHAAGQSRLWVNLEYLSAEDWVERSHALPSPQRSGALKWFYFPGFTPATGGLLREPELLATQAGFDRHAWLADTLDLRLSPGERVLTLFHYPQPRLAEALQAWTAGAESVTHLLVAPGYPQQALAGLALPPRTVAHALPHLDHAGFDRLLWSADLNVVRGEDSVLRAIWAGAPFVWHIYPQHDDAHHAKLLALLQRLGLDEAQAPGLGVEAVWRAFNGLPPLPGAASEANAKHPWPAAPPLAPWRVALAAGRAALLVQTDLVSQLLGFGAAKATPRSR